MKVIVNGEGKKSFIPYHLEGGKWQAGAGTDLWPLWKEELLLAHCRGRRILEFEGEKCAQWSQAGGLLATTQPGHAHTEEAIQARYARLNAAGVEGVYYMPDNDQMGQDKAQRCASSAKAAGFPFQILSPPAVWPELGQVTGGSIDNANGSPVERVEAIKRAIEAGHARPPSAECVVASEDKELAQASAAEHLANLNTHIDLESVLPPMLAKRLSTRAAAFPIDPVALLVPLLCTVAGVIGTRCRVVVKRGWSEPLVIWGGNVIPPGALKSPVGEVFCNPLKELQQGSFDAHKSATQVQKVIDDHRGSDDGKQDNRDTPPPPRRWVVMDATYERVAEMIAAPNTVGLVSFQDELATWFANLDRQVGSGARPGWLSLWSGGAAFIDRKVANSSFAYKTAVSLFGNIQPEKLQQLIQKSGDDPASAGDGLWSRFLWCRPPSSAWRYVPDGCDIRPEILAMLRGLDTVPTGLELHLSPEAIELMVPWLESWSEEGLNSSPARSAFLAKLRGYTVRLAGIAHLLECYENSSVLPGPAFSTFDTTVGTVAMDRALLMATFFLAQFDAISTEMGGGSLPTDVASFLRWVKEGDRKEVRPRDLLTGPRFARGWKTADGLAFLKRVAEGHEQGEVVQGLRKDSFIWRCTGS
ncbi:MAG: DUF3987 domain-containing protein [Synechococcaceae cyanobacterium ELA445]